MPEGASERPLRLDDVWPWGLSYSTIVTFRWWVAFWTCGLLVGMAIGLTVAYLLAYRLGLTNQFLLGLAAFTGTIAGVMLCRFGILRSLLHTKGFRVVLSLPERVRIRHQTNDEDDSDEPNDPQRFAIAPDALQPRLDLVAQARSIPLPLDLYSRRSLLPALAVCIPMTVIFAALMEPLMLWRYGTDLLTFRGQLAVLDFVLPKVGFFAIILFLANVLTLVTAGRDKLTLTEGDISTYDTTFKRRESVQWQDIRAWSVRQTHDVFDGPQLMFTIWGWNPEAQMEDDLLDWAEPYTGPGFHWWPGHRAYRARADRVHAIIAANVRQPLRLEPESR